MDASRSRMLLGTRRYSGGSNGRISIADASRNPTLLRWQRWTHLDRGCFQEPDVTKVAATDALPSRMLLGTRRYQGGSDGRIAIADASRNPKSPRWQRGRVSIADALF